MKQAKRIVRLSTRSLLVLFTLNCATIVVAQDESYPTALNSGFNSALFVLELNRVPISSQQLIDQLKTDVHLTKVISPIQIAEALSRNGLHCRPVNIRAYDQIGSILDQASALILQLKLEHGIRYVLLREEAGLVHYYDYPIFDKPYEKKTLLAGFKAAPLPAAIVIAGDEQLLSRIVEDLPAYQETNPVAVLSSPVPSAEKQVEQVKGDQLVFRPFVELGRIPIGSKHVEGSIMIRNESDSGCNLSSFKGSCSCFRGAGNPPAILAHQKVEVPLVFDVSMRPPDSDFTTSIVLSSSDKALPATIIQVHGSFDSERQALVVPSQIDLGRLQRSQLSGRREQIIIYAVAPVSDVFRLLKINSSDSAVRVRQVSSPEKESRGGLVEISRFEVSFDGDRFAKGSHHFDVFFQTNQPVYKELECSIDVDLID